MEQATLADKRIACVKPCLTDITGHLQPTKEVRTIESATASTPFVVYFSSVSENTHRFVQKLGFDSARIPLKPKQEGMIRVDRPFVLIVPTYGGGSMKGAVPPQVKAFLNIPENRALIRGVISAGNTNFGEAYCAAGQVISQKCHVPQLYRFELLGTSHDVDIVRDGLRKYFAPEQAASPV
ncbi:class Ib ribonucleoside-diphosphate reductase assembly flavoprotein NrdI [Corynebacterium sp. ES2794-CONJ1]|uniref:class Ib ribonucleoside-diphosphate reductase assembly flavoprotein NrdI n=1 Tax=unclassified Corynebacterium TaxID=2624378 RepID=UPI00216AA4F2|nr:MULTISPECIES: class Ib ribonucleoside-diphosphate reductase assembly flavoprotein NrdI [unclassified Corynebacterium]MCS4490534.1 class Ib ribonucleoside-diphosphate reductase assembly flavoprotein NrdI [Corynebacterium sp. ES2775-CONJ]MCS4492313.1 class Ib ribonucleoside-diphosphate reductase assembly flavoprotein NrdI [Corynebacterium sp. ES2715-CONJ3]MCS4532495.1 class Ib ribonucleoside-diphosphate reductase assembly flavoprotein NrdI [Corynebacterium sp. ES2730-CONJ]MCU9519890.1 class Ib